MDGSGGRLNFSLERPSWATANSDLVGEWLIIFWKTFLFSGGDATPVDIAYLYAMLKFPVLYAARLRIICGPFFMMGEAGTVFVIFRLGEMDWLLKLARARIPYMSYC